MVWNKKFQFVAKIYDMQKSILFETSDVSVKMLDETDGLTEFLVGAAKMIEKGTAYSANKTTAATTQGTGVKTSTTPTATTQQPTTGTQTGGNVVSLQTRPKTTIGNGWRGKDYSGYNGYDDDDDPYGKYYN